MEENIKPKYPIFVAQRLEETIPAAKIFKYYLSNQVEEEIKDKLKAFSKNGKVIIHPVKIEIIGYDT